MARNAVGEGQLITITAAGTVAAGDVLEGADAIGVYQTAAVAGQKVAVKLMGEVELPKETPLVITALDRVYWDAVNNRIDKTGTNIPAGIATADAASAATRVRVLLNV